MYLHIWQALSSDPGEGRIGIVLLLRDCFAGAGRRSGEVQEPNEGVTGRDGTAQTGTR